MTQTRKIRKRDHAARIQEPIIAMLAGGDDAVLAGLAQAYMVKLRARQICEDGGFDSLAMAEMRRGDRRVKLIAGVDLPPGRFDRFRRTIPCRLFVLTAEGEILTVPARRRPGRDWKDILIWREVPDVIARPDKSTRWRPSDCLGVVPLSADGLLPLLQARLRAHLQVARREKASEPKEQMALAI